MENLQSAVGSVGDIEGTTRALLETLDEMGLKGVSGDSVLTAPPFYSGPVVFEQPNQFAAFSGRIAVKLRFVGYPFEDVAFLTVAQLARMFVADSFPETPPMPLAGDQYAVHHGSLTTGMTGTPNDIPICFVLGAPRSGTTLLRAMLNVHSGLWAPGELHFASYSSMADRAADVGPILRYMPIPECAARCSESLEDFSATFRGWERRGATVAEVYDHLHRAEPDVMVVDKTPGYSVRLSVLERIHQLFPNARYVYLVRSPHDAIRSFVRLQLHRGNRRLFEAGRNPYQIAETIWFACNTNADKFLKGIPAERKCALRYEDLTQSPTDSLERICQMLGRSVEPAMADPYSAPGAVAQGAGDLHIHLKTTVEARPAAKPFYELGEPCQELAAGYGY